MPTFKFPQKPSPDPTTTTNTYLPALIHDVWQTFYHNKKIHWIEWPCFIRSDVDIIITCPGLNSIIPCHFRVLRELVPFFNDFGTFDSDAGQNKITGVDEPSSSNTKTIATASRLHTHNPFRPPSHVTFAELTSTLDGKALLDIIALCYTNTVVIEEENVVGMYKVANLLHMKDLCKVCVGEMGKEINLDNAVKYWTVADGNESVCSSVVEELNDITQVSRDLCTTQFNKLNTGRFYGNVAEMASKKITPKTPQKRP